MESNEEKNVINRLQIHRKTNKKTKKPISHRSKTKNIHTKTGQKNIFSKVKSITIYVEKGKHHYK